MSTPNPPFPGTPENLPHDPAGQPTPQFPGTPHNPHQFPTGQPIPPQSPEPKKNWFARNKVLTGVIAVVLVAGIYGATQGKKDDAPATAPTASQTTKPADAVDNPTTQADKATPPADEASEDAGSPDISQEPAGEPAIGEEVAVGEFAVTVNGIETGVEKVSSIVGAQEAQGQFVLVRVSITNNGTEPDSYWPNNQILLDDQGRRFEPDLDAIIYTDEDTIHGASINPSMSVAGVIIYDIPKDAVPTAIELNDSLIGSAGAVRVNLQ